MNQNAWSCCGSQVVVGHLERWIPFCMSRQKLEHSFGSKVGHNCNHIFCHKCNDCFYPKLAPWAQLIHWALKSFNGSSNHALGLQVKAQAFK